VNKQVLDSSDRLTRRESVIDRLQAGDAEAILGSAERARTDAPS
jgi:hypothetical protein